MMNFIPCYHICYSHTLNWLIGFRFYIQLSHEGPGTIGEMPSLGVFLRNPCIYESFGEYHGNFERLISVDKRDLELNLAPLIYKFWVSHTLDSAFIVKISKNWTFIKLRIIQEYHFKSWIRRKYELTSTFELSCYHLVL